MQCLNKYGKIKYRNPTKNVKNRINAMIPDTKDENIGLLVHLNPMSAFKTLKVSQMHHVSKISENTRAL